MPQTQLENKRLKVDLLMRAITDYVQAEISASTNQDPDSMGPYYEEKTLQLRIEELLGMEPRDA